MKVGILDAGGGVRGIYGAGVLDYCLEKGIRFDYGIGVSAGAANIASYKSGQSGRNYTFYVEYTQRPEYMSARNFLRNGSYIDLEYAYGTLSNSGGEYPMDYDAYIADPLSFEIVATEVMTGKAPYFSGDDLSRDAYQVFMATCCVPVINKPYEVDGVPYYDGALSDPLPVDRALSQGCDKLVLIVTRPRDFIRKNNKDRKLARLIQRKYPAAARAFTDRAELYNTQMRRAKELEKEGRLLLIAPDDIGDLDTLSHAPEALRHLYIKGLKDARAIPDFLAR